MKNSKPSTTVSCDCVIDRLLKAGWLETTSIRSPLPGSEGWEIAEFSGNSEGDGKAWVEEQHGSSHYPGTIQSKHDECVSCHLSLSNKSLHPPEFFKKRGRTENVRNGEVYVLRTPCDCALLLFLFMWEQRATSFPTSQQSSVPHCQDVLHLQLSTLNSQS